MKPNFAILVVDIDAAALAELVDLLRGAGYKATGAPTFEIARQLLETSLFDLLITDVRLMAHNGLHLVVRSQILHRAPTAIVLSSFPDAVDETEARRLGVSYLARPVDPSTLLALVSKTLEGAMQSKRGQNWAKVAALVCVLVAIAAIARAASPLLIAALTAGAAALSAYGSLRAASRDRRPRPRNGGEPADPSLQKLDSLERDRPFALSSAVRSIRYRLAGALG
jgi:DNA-binding NtrC family response regulator